MSSHEFTEWMAFYRIEPWGDERADLRAGMVAATFANTFRPKGQKPYQATDFLLKFGGKVKQSAEDMLRVIRQTILVMGGEDKTQGR